MALEVIESPQQRLAVLSLFVSVGLGAAVTFLIPLYIQTVQGRTSLRTGLAITPYSLSIFAASILVLRLFDRLPVHYIARYAFAVVAAGLALLAVVIRNEWETFMVILGLTVVGLGLGALVTLLFTVLAAGVPEEMAGDVGSLRGTTNNLAGAIGTAIAGALLIGVLSASVMMKLVDNPVIPNELKEKVDLDNIKFVSNDRLLETLAQTTAAPDQVDEALRINTEARLRSLRICFVALTGLALLAIFPAGRLAGYVGGDAAGNPKHGKGETG
jgi:MFS family permease